MHGERLRAVLTVLVLLTLALCICWFYIIHMFPTVPVVPPAVSPEPRTESEDCGAVVVTCTAKYEDYLDTCDEKEVETLASDELADPLVKEGCSDAQTQLGERCPAGCKLSYTSVVSVPGKIKLEFEGKPNESGKCLVSAKRTVTLKGSCVR